MVVETPEYMAAARRFVRAAGRRAGQGDPEDLTELLTLGGVLAEAQQVAVDGLREAGFSWAEIARAAGVSRQSAHERWGKAERRSA